PSDPGHALWRRDYQGASGLMGVWLQPDIGREDLRRMVDGLTLFRLGGSWGGFESLVFPVMPSSARGLASASEPAYMRLHVGLEDIDDLQQDLAAGLDRLHS